MPLREWTIATAQTAASSSPSPKPSAASPSSNERPPTEAATPSDRGTYARARFVGVTPPDDSSVDVEVW